MRFLVAAALCLPAVTAQAQSYTTMPYGDGYITRPAIGSSGPTFTTTPYGDGYITRPAIGSDGFASGFSNSLEIAQRFKMMREQREWEEQQRYPGRR